MTATQQWITDAVDGGFNKYPSHWDLTDSETISPIQILIEPDAWKAVEKVRWGKTHIVENPKDEAWRYNWDVFFNLLAEGESIESALSEL